MVSAILPGLPAPAFILASSSPRRQSLLKEAGYIFEIDAAEIDESAYPPGKLPAQIALYLAEEKAKAVAARHVEQVVLAADTVVAFGDMLIGKPIDAAHAKQILTLLSGTTHLVITGIAVANLLQGFFKSLRVMSAVRMRDLTPGEIDRYVAGNDWHGKAGGYGIQDNDPFVTKLSGSKSNIVGLPMTATRALLAEAGITPAS